MQRFTQKILQHNAAVFSIFWCVLFLLYLPAAQCGWVSDTLGWLDAVRNQSFGEYINRSHFGVHSFYQTTQFITWCLYRTFGANHWAWHIIHISLHALNCSLFFVLIKGLLQDSRVPACREWAFIAAALFCTSPYASEVVVWEASFHYLQGLLFILCIQLLLHSYLHNKAVRTAVAAAVLFAVSIFSLELFYLTPLFTAALLLYYRYALPYDPIRIRSAARTILLPQLGLLFLHLVLVRIVLGTTSARLGDALFKMPLSSYAVKPPGYFFHLIGGRFLPQSLRNAYHQFICTYTGAGIFYLILLSAIFFVIIHFRKMQRTAQLISLAFILLLFAMGLVTPMWFPERLLIMGDRYLYTMLPFFFMAIVLLISRVRFPLLRVTICVFIIVLQCGLTLYLSRVWQMSQWLTDRLQKSYTPAPGQQVLLLNSPASLKGASMIGAGADGEFGLMHNLLYQPPLADQPQDVLAANLISGKDNTQIRVLNDSMIEVDLPKPGSFWWYGSDYAKSYQTTDYSVHLTDPSKYILTLHGNPSRFLLLCQKAGRWETVKMLPGQASQRQ